MNPALDMNYDAPKPVSRENPWIWHVMDYEVELRTNPENADIGNPRGVTYGFRYVVTVEHLNGRRWQSSYHDDKLDAIELASLWDWLGVGPSASDCEIEPAYGSQAYARGGYEEDWAQREREDDMAGHY